MVCNKEDLTVGGVFFSARRNWLDCTDLFWSDRAFPFKLRKRQGLADFCIDVRSKIPVEKRMEASLFLFHHAKSEHDEWKDDGRCCFWFFSTFLSCRLLVFTCFLILFFPIRGQKNFWVPPWRCLEGSWFVRLRESQIWMINGGTKSKSKKHPLQDAFCDDTTRVLC